MSDFASPDGDAAAPAQEGFLARLAYGVGSVGILGATLADFLGVAGRHAGLHLLGAIELVQAAVVLLAASAMFVVTLAAGHASVHFVHDWVGKGGSALLHRIADLAGAVMFLLLAAGSAWVLSDMWAGYEATELVGIPLRWLRLVWIVFTLLIAGAFLRRLLRRRS